MQELTMWEIEDENYAQGVEVICGVDEAGRGPLAGPVVAAAVILPEYFDVPGVDDSKKLSEKRREELFDIITERAVAYGIGMADHSIIDEINILQASYLFQEDSWGGVSDNILRFKIYLLKIFSGIGYVSSGRFFLWPP